MGSIELKRLLRSIGRSLASWPILGRFVRITIHLTRLPEFREATLEANARLALLTHQAETMSKSIESLKETLAKQQERAASTASDIAARLYRFENDQIPRLLSTIADLNHRQLTDKKDIDNLVQSFPISLRSLKRNVVETNQSLGALAAAVDEQGRSNALSLQESLASHIAAFDQRMAEHASQTWDGIINEAGKTRQALDTLLHESLAPLHAERTDLEERLAQLAARNATSTDEYDTLRGHLDALNQSTEYLLNRVEFIRREVMFEMRYGAGTDEKMDDVEPEIVDAEKLKVARKTGLKLNLGCGHIALDDYINVDRRKLPGVDIVADIDALPLKKGEATEIFSAHVLEHFPQEQLKRELLPYWVDLLKKGGQFRAVVPDAEAMTQHYAKGDYPYDDFREVMYGSQDYDGDFHYNMFTPDSLTALLEEAGLKDVELIESGRKNGACYEFEILAKK
tara:strand:- start:18517 stop:19881 length:1365 start_codon:yes stop_codon:yes gene_type:complete